MRERRPPELLRAVDLQPRGAGDNLPRRIILCITPTPTCFLLILFYNDIHSRLLALLRNRNTYSTTPYFLSPVTASHNLGKMMSSKRLQKELLKIQGQLAPGITLVSAENLKTWLMDIQVMDANPIYQGNIFRLKFEFSNNYPIEPPEVVFVRHSDRPIPMHPHIYSNGIICLDLLAAQGWSPVQNVESICLSIQSMLTGNSKNERPPGDADFVRNNRLRPRDVAFHFHDNEV
ncbi:UBC-like protein [Aureobasidium pullulans]|nr:UBC-like protein [Aureobasidium pullulans]